MQRRGLNKQKAALVKKRFDALQARENNGLLEKQVNEAKYERNMRHFDGWKEPEFYSPYGSRDIRVVFAYIRHEYRVWKAFHEHTGHWPVFSIWFHFLSGIVVYGLFCAGLIWIETQKWVSGWYSAAVVVCFLLLLSARNLGARQIRKLDWRRFGT
jgi:hypothetical protein